MRDTIDFGIDLGTTNSAMAVVRGADVSVVKNNEGWDYTPSAVYIPKPGVVYVGRDARDRYGREPANVHLEFKQEMGTPEVGRRFEKAGLSLTPPELSAEVLKSLRFDAAEQFGEPPQVAVITVPAAFSLSATNATSEAAALAGFGVCPLVQEPTAAAFAYGFQNSENEACWMVFDFGGGTFDAAVVSTYEGELRVLDHMGDPHLGGKQIDWAIVERILAPAFAEEYGLTDFTRGNPKWHADLVKLKVAAENAKIALSRRVEYDLLVDVEFEGGRKETFEYGLRRGDVDRLAEPYYVRAINLCRDALAKANLRPDDIDRLLLVGGTTLAPGLRERLADPTAGLGIELDHSQDPTTVVARGAAVVAGTIPLPRTKTAPVAGEFTVDLRYPRTTSLRTVPVAGRFESVPARDWTGYHVILDNAEGKPPFRTAQVALDPSGAFDTEVQVNELTASNFAVLLTNPGGGTEKVRPAAIVINHWAQEPAGPVLTNSVGLSQADRTFAPILAKGTQLPSSAREIFHTTVALHRTDAESVIRIPIVEGEHKRADRNHQVGLIEIRPKDVRIDLPEGSDVEVTVEVDESRRVTVVVDVPLVDEQFEAVIDLSSVRPPAVRDLERELRAVRQRLEELRASARTSGSAQARKRLDRLDEEHLLEGAQDEVRAATEDSGSASAADQRLREIQAELDEVEADVGLPLRLAALSEGIDRCRELVGRVGDDRDRAELAEFGRRRDLLSRADPDPKAVDELILRAAEFERDLMNRDGTLDIAIFYYFRTHRHELGSPTEVRRLIAEGEAAIRRNDWQALPAVNDGLRRLLPPSAPDPVDGGIQLRRGPGR